MPVHVVMKSAGAADTIALKICVFVPTMWYWDRYIREKILCWQYSVTVCSAFCRNFWSRWLSSKRRFNLLSFRFLEFTSFM